MKNVTIRCKTCGKEIFGGMSEEIQRTTTIWDANNSECSTCLINSLIGEEDRPDPINEWVNKNAEYLALEYSGRYLVVDRQGVIVSGKTAAEVFEFAGDGRRIIKVP